MPVDVEAEDVVGERFCFVRVAGELDAAGLAASAGQHLGLDDDLAGEHLGSRACLGRRARHAPVGDGYPKAREELLALVLVQVHGRPL